MPMEYYSGIPDRIFNLFQFSRYPGHPGVCHEEWCHQRDCQLYRPTLFDSPHVRIDDQACHHIGCSDIPERNGYQFCPLCQFHFFTRDFCRSRSRGNGRRFDGIDRIAGISSRLFTGTKCSDDDHISGSRRLWSGMQRKRRRCYYPHHRPYLR